MKWRSISSVTSKSAITPSFSGRIAWIVPGVRPSMRLASMPDRVHFAGARVDRDDARLGQHDPAPAHVDERVGGPEVDRHVAAAEACQIAEDAHRSGVGCVCWRVGREIRLWGADFGVSPRRGERVRRPALARGAV